MGLSSFHLKFKKFPKKKNLVQYAKAYGIHGVRIY